jgi:hypothetical protein
VRGGDPTEGFAERLSRQGEEALGRLAEEIARNPLLGGAVSRASDARERAARAQEAAMSALNVPSAADLERLTRRLRAVSQRLEGIEDAVDRLDARLESLAAAGGPGEGRGADGLGARLEGADGLEARLEEIARDLAAVREAVGAAENPPPRAQERLKVAEP